MPNPDDDLTKVFAVMALGLSVLGLLAIRKVHSDPGVLARSRDKEWFRIIPVPAGGDEPVPTVEVETV